MSQWDKLLKRICSLSNDMRFDELKKVYVEMVKDVVESEVSNDENT